MKEYKTTNSGVLTMSLLGALALLLMTACSLNFHDAPRGAVDIQLHFWDAGVSSETGRFLLPGTGEIHLRAESFGQIMARKILAVSWDASGQGSAQGSLDALPLGLNITLVAEIITDDGTAISQAKAPVILTSGQAKQIELILLPLENHPDLIPVPWDNPFPPQNLDPGESRIYLLQDLPSYLTSLELNWPEGLDWSWRSPQGLLLNGAWEEDILSLDQAIPEVYLLAYNSGTEGVNSFTPNFIDPGDPALLATLEVILVLNLPSELDVVLDGEARLSRSSTDHPSEMNLSVEGDPAWTYTWLLNGLTSHPAMTGSESSISIDSNADIGLYFGVHTVTLVIDDGVQNYSHQFYFEVVE